MTSQRQTGNNLGCRQARFPQLQSIGSVFLISMQCINKSRLGFVFLTSAMSNGWARVQQRLSSHGRWPWPSKTMWLCEYEEALPRASSSMSPKTSLPPGPQGWQRLPKGLSFRWIFNRAYLETACVGFPSWNRGKRTLTVTVPIQWPNSRRVLSQLK